MECFARILAFNHSPAVGSTSYWVFCPILYFSLLWTKDSKSFSFFFEVVNAS